MGWFADIIYLFIITSQQNMVKMIVNEHGANDGELGSLTIY